MNRKTRALALGAALGLLACGDDDNKVAPSADSGTGTASLPAAAIDAGTTSVIPGIPGAADAGGTPVAPAPSIDASSAVPVVPVTPAVPPLYLAATRVFTPDGASTTTYLQVLASIEAGSKLELAKAQEFAGAAELFNIAELGWFGVGDGESPVLTRYTASADGKLVAGQKLNLSAYGVSEFFAANTYVVSKTKIYYPDPDGKQLLIINPTDMKVDGVVALPQTAREGYTAVYSYASTVRAGKLLFSVGWFDWTNDKILPETGLVVLDTNTNAVARFDVDPRCGGITQPVTISSGDTYFASSALAGALFKLGRTTTAPCALRVVASADNFDATYALKLSDLAAGAIAGEPIPAGGDEIFLRVLDDKLVTIKADTASWGVTGEPAWNWVRWNVVSGQVSPLALAPSGSDNLWFVTDGRVFAGQSTKDYTNTTLIELTAAGGPKPALTSPGFFSGLAKIR